MSCFIIYLETSLEINSTTVRKKSLEEDEEMTTGRIKKMTFTGGWLCRTGYPRRTELSLATCGRVKQQAASSPLVNKAKMRSDSLLFAAQFPPNSKHATVLT